MNNDWDDNEAPLAYLITFRTFGTWLHGKNPSSVDRHGKNVYGAEKVLPSRNLERQMTENRRCEIFILNGKQRSVVEKAIREMCKKRGYELIAINVRTNHVHVVVTAYVKPEKILNAMKANATRELREAGLIALDQKIWTRGGSRRYLWKPAHVNGAVDYVLYGQGDDLPNF